MTNITFQSGNTLKEKLYISNISKEVLNDLIMDNKEKINKYYLLIKNIKDIWKFLILNKIF